jgi:hypothetical protein
MKEQILKIAQDLEQGIITDTEAQNLLLGLFGVSVQLPTDEEISQADIALFDEYVVKEYTYIGGLFSKGAKWMRDKIYKGN